MNAALDADVIVIGAGIAGLAAAVRLKDYGLTCRVLERSGRVGGRMTTDRIGGFVIDRGVTLPTRSFTRMRALVRRFGIAGMHDIEFELGINGSDGNTRSYRARRFDDILLDSTLSLSARFAFLRTGLDLARFDRRLAHGDGDKTAALDTESSRAYMSRFGRGGDELLQRVFEPGIRGAIGASLAESSRAVLFTVARNTMLPGFWNLRGGLDQLPEALAAHVAVEKDARVRNVRLSRAGVEVEADIQGSRRTLTARGAILAVPGHIAASLCATLPPWLARPLQSTQYAQMACVFVALDARPGDESCTGYAFEDGAPSQPVSVSLEHRRAPANCPQGKALICAYFAHSPAFPCLSMSDDALGDHAVACIRRTLAMGDADVLFAHVIRWESGLATFAPGRFKEMAGVRELLARWDAPLDCCGDYLDGIASEGALRTGEQAAQRMAQRLSHAPSVNRSSASPSIRSWDMSSRDRASHAAAH